MESAREREAGSGRRYFMGLAVIIGVGAALRFFMIDKESLWFDEGLSVWFAQRPLAELWGAVPSYETHPPLYYTILKGWMALFGESEAAVRSLSALAGVMTIPLAYLLGVIAIGGERGSAAGLGAAFIFALAPVQLVYAQEARPYALLILSSTLAICGAAAFITQPFLARLPYFGFKSGGLEGRNARLAWLALITGAGLSLWLHNMGVLLILSLILTLPAILALNLGYAREVFKNAAMAGVIILALWSPFLPWFAHQSSNVKGSFWLAEGSRWISTGLNHLFLFLIRSWIVKGAILALAGGGLYALIIRRGWLSGMALCGLMVIPPAAAIIMSALVKPMFLARTILWVSVPFYLLAGVGLSMFPGWRMKAPLALLLAYGLINGDRLYYEGYIKEPWREITGRIAANASDNDLVLLLPNGAQSIFSYYLKGSRPHLKTLPLPQSFPAAGLAERRYPTGNMAQPALDEKDAPFIGSLSCQKGDIWVVMRLPQLFDPESIIATALNGKCSLLEENTFSVVHYKRYTKKYPLSDMEKSKDK